MLALVEASAITNSVPISTGLVLRATGGSDVADHFTDINKMVSARIGWRATSSERAA